MGPWILVSETDDRREMRRLIDSDVSYGDWFIGHGPQTGLRMRHRYIQHRFEVPLFFVCLAKTDRGEKPLCLRETCYN